MQICKSLLMTPTLPIALAVLMCTTAFAQQPWDGTIVQYGEMHEAIGQHQDQGRVRLSDLVKQPHFFAVAALEGLAGEITILDDKVTISGVDSDGKLTPIEDTDGTRQATMLVGAYVPSWTRHSVPSHVSTQGFDQFIADAASAAGVNTDNPFLFRMQGEFTDVSLHVIHGACPIHARMQKINLPKEERPFESDIKKVTGTLVGVYAKDAVGKLTHPATSTHVHLIYEDETTGELLTGHIEKVGLSEGAILMLPN
ncbi:Alpha-acetolactate decarboxylase [Neorhodopirellula lusitana]|uniref:Alpha-acetolactate decarboxylase n=1 Tax=Neorhodopirellula lusitana TaxID=445327 RepID=A0ABY1Q8N9_9BACT|nr:acetolactate decarboxylase [Neorhodopirellula lusitana]SMP60934.1 Alpha-acetolactate decarboxylase [Neorhodopirellula lusitana]